MIAGIPFDKVHHLDFAPGELRLDVNMQSTLELYNQRLKDKNEEYQDIVKSGQKELSRLRSLDAEDIVSKKDVKIEKERLEAEQQQRKASEEREKARKVKEEKEREVRAQLAKQRDEERIKQRGGAASGEDKSFFSPLILGGGFATLIGAALGGGTASREEGAKSYLAANKTEALLEDVPLGPDTPHLNSTTTPFVDAEMNQPVVPEASDLINDEARNKETPEQAVNDRSGSNEPAQKIDAATKAMQDYLDEDDGGDAWLRSMNEILQEDKSDPDGNMPFDITESGGHSFQ